VRRRPTKAPCNRSWPCTVSPLKPSSPCSRCRPRCSRRFPGVAVRLEPLDAIARIQASLWPVAKCRASGQARGPALGQAKHLAQVQVWIPACRFRRLGAGICHHVLLRVGFGRIGVGRGFCLWPRWGRPRLCRSNCQRHAVLTSLRRRCPRRRCPRRRRLRFHRHVPPFLRRCLRCTPAACSSALAAGCLGPCRAPPPEATRLARARMIPGALGQPGRLAGVYTGADE